MSGEAGLAGALLVLPWDRSQADVPHLVPVPRQQPCRPAVGRSKDSV